MTTNDLMKVTRASVYFGEYKKARKSGYTQWCKVVLYYTPMAKDPITDELYPLDGVEGYVSMFVAESAAESMIAAAKEHGTKMPDVTNGYTISVDFLPRAYRYAYTERWTLTGEWIEFDTLMVKVDLDGKRIKYKDGKHRTCTKVFVKYWEGPGVELTTLCRNARMEQATKEWKPVNLPHLEKDEEKKDVNDDNSEETGA